MAACEYIQFIFIGMSLFSDWDSSEDIVTGRGGGLLRNLAPIPCKDNSFISLPKVLNPLWRTRGLLVGNKGFLLVVKRLGREACHLHSSCAEAKNKCGYTSISPQRVFWLRARTNLHGVHTQTDQLTYTILRTNLLRVVSIY